MFAVVDIAVLADSWQIVRILFPTSDKYHPVVTPALILMAQLLARCTVQTLQCIAKGLFVAELALSYVTESKRFIPEALNFLAGVLSLAADPPAQAFVLPHFQALHTKKLFLLALTPAECEHPLALRRLTASSTAAELAPKPLPLSSLLGNEAAYHPIDAIVPALQLASNFAELYSSHPCLALVLDCRADGVQRWPRRSSPWSSRLARCLLSIIRSRRL